MFAAFLLGIIQGITELFPVSSSGHLLLIGTLNDSLGLGLDLSFQNTSFDVILHVASFLAIVIFYRKVLRQMLLNAKTEAGRNLLRNLALTALPALVAGGALFILGDGAVKQPVIASFALIIVGIFLIIAEFKVPAEAVAENTSSRSQLFTSDPKDYTPLGKLTVSNALTIGIIQAFSLIRGVSRSGSTMLGGLTQGLSRSLAVDYAFLSGLPLFAVLTLVEIWQLTSNPSVVNASVAQLVIGFLTTFIVSLLALSAFKRLIKLKGALAGFGIYRIILGLIILFLLVQAS